MSNENIQSTADKIRGLLNKAASTTFAEEANALLAKAAELMAKYSITEAQLGDKREDKIEDEIIYLSRYRIQKVTLLVGLCKAFGCHVTHLVTRGKEYYGVIGFRSDLDMLRQLLDSLELQLDRELLMVTGDGVTTTKSARTQFASSWSQTVYQRVKAFYAEAIAEAEQEAKVTGSTSTALVLASRDEQVTDAFEEKYGYKPKYGTRKATHSYTRSYAEAGASAGHRADIGVKKVDGNRGALTS